MASNLVSLSYEVANLAGARRPVLEVVATGLPATSTGGGVPTATAVSALVHVTCRPYPWGRRAYYVVDTFDASATYTLEVDGNSVSEVTPATLADLLADLAAAANADPTIGADWSATVIDYDGDGVDDGILVSPLTTSSYYGEGAPGYPVDGSATGSAVVSVYADPESVELAIYGRTVDVPGEAVVAGVEAERYRSWAILEAPTATGDARYVVGERGIQKRIDVAGFAAIAAVLSSPLGVVGDGISVELTPRAWVSPARLESTT
jgi:hypothetical protein